MSMITCPECKKSVSNLADTCPHCGFPIAKMRSKTSVSDCSVDNDVVNENTFLPRKKKPFLILSIVSFTLAALLFIIYFVGNIHEHNYVSNEIQHATCSCEGVLEFTCSICGKKYIETTPLNDEHTLHIVKNQPATCSKDGYKAYECTLCDYSYQETLSKIKHTWSSATCTAPQKCLDCGSLQGSVAPHNFNKYGICTECGIFSENDIDSSRFIKISSSRSLSSGMIEGDLIIKNGVTFTCYGMLTNNVIVESGAKLILYGMIGENLIVCDSGSVTNYGTVGIAALGTGYIDHHGIIGHNIDDTIVVYAHKNSYIGSHHFTEDTLINKSDD